MISKIEIWIEDENEAAKLAAELKGKGYKIQGPYYTNGYGAPINYAGPNEKCDSPKYPGMTESEACGED